MLFRSKDSVTAFLSAPRLPCPSMCPAELPNTSDSEICDIDNGFVCAYGDAVTCEDEFGMLYHFLNEQECHCSEGRFQCSFNCQFPGSVEAGGHEENSDKTKNGHSKRKTTKEKSIKKVGESNTKAKKK